MAVSAAPPDSGLESRLPQGSVDAPGLSGRLLPGLQSIRHQHLPDGPALAEALIPAGRLLNFRPLVPDRQFAQFAGRLDIQQVPLLSYCGAAVQYTLDPLGLLSLHIHLDGCGHILDPLGQAQFSRHSAVLLARGAGPRTVTSATGLSVAMLNLAPEALWHTALSMRGMAPDAHTPPPDFTRFPPRTLAPQQAQPLRSLLRHIDACAASDPSLPERLGLDDVILRLAATWLTPSLAEGQSLPEPGRSRERSGRSAFDDLIDHIRANLDQPLRLSDLEARSFYSRRALQYAFRDRFGCSPIQWIREQRLGRAMEQLQSNPEKRLGVRTVGLACGYRHMSQFSADFKRRFGMSPSEVQRPKLN